MVVRDFFCKFICIIRVLYRSSSGLRFSPAVAGIPNWWWEYIIINNLLHVYLVVSKNLVVSLFTSPFYVNSQLTKSFFPFSIEIFFIAFWKFWACWIHFNFFWIFHIWVDWICIIPISPSPPSSSHIPLPSLLSHDLFYHYYCWFTHADYSHVTQIITGFIYGIYSIISHSYLKTVFSILMNFQNLLFVCMNF